MPSFKLTQCQLALKRNVKHFRDFISLLEKQCIIYISSVMYSIAESIVIGNLPVHQYLFTEWLLFEEFSEDWLNIDKSWILHSIDNALDQSISSQEVWELLMIGEDIESYDKIGKETVIT